MSIQAILFKKAKNGKLQKWSIELDGARFRTHEGFDGGVITTSEWTTCIPKRVGSSNATSPAEQAAKEVVAKIKKQTEKGYTEDPTKVEESAKKISPMLAYKFEDYRDQLPNGVYTQPKLDGIRCIATRTGLYTRNGKPITAAPHIYAQAKIILAELPEGSKLDGELYNHELKADFNKITSLVRKQNPSEYEIKEASKLLQYHVYDIDIPDLTFQQRTMLLWHTVADLPVWAVHLVETTFVRSDINNLDEPYGKWLEQGYEGQMIRTPSSLYEHSRSKSLLKRKEFEESEYIIRDIEEGVGNRSGMMGRIRFDGFDANSRGTHDYFRELLKNKKKYIGKQATVRYQNLTPAGVPRFPVMIAIRDYE